MADRLISGNGKFEVLIRDNGAVDRYEFATGINTNILPGVIGPDPEPEPEPEPIPGPRPEVRWPSIGASYYTSMTDPDVDLPVFARFLRDVGVKHTRTWLLDAWALGEREADGTFKKGQYDGLQPVTRSPVGPFNLGEWNDAYWTHLRRYVDTLNAYGIWPHLTLLELYTWSDRKKDLPFVPRVEWNLFRNNVNGIRWGDPDDATFESLPDAWMADFIDGVVGTLAGTSYALEIGNEMPEKPMHYRIRDAVQATDYPSSITVNRQIDSPGQYWNMGIDRGDFDRIAFHGKLDIGYLDEQYHDEAPAGRPTTFREAWPMYDASRVILSSDGGGGNPERQPDLLVVAQDALARGGSYEHQLALKRNRFYGDGTLRMEDLELDRDFLKVLTGA